MTPGRARATGGGAAILLAAAFLLPAAPAALAEEPGAPRPENAGDPARDLKGIRELLRRGEKGKALEAARAAVAEAPDDVEAHLLYQDAARGQIPVALLQGEYKTRYAQKKGGDSACLYGRLLPPAEGEKLLAEAVKGEPRSYWAQVGYAEAAARVGKAVPAETAALAAMELRPGDPEAASRAGAQCAVARRFPAAEACYRKALGGIPSDANARLGLVHAVLRQGRGDEAAAALTELQGGTKPDPRVLLLEAAIAAEKGDLAGAEKALVQATTLSPNDVDAGMQLALLRLRKADAVPRPPGKHLDPRAVAAEVAQLQKAAAALPERAEFRYSLGFAHEVTGDPNAALEDYREASRLDPLDGDVIVAIGAILVARNQLEEAAREFERALDRNPDDAGALFQLGFVLDQQGKSKEAVPHYQRLVKLRPEDARAWHAYGICLNALAKPRDAAPALQKAADLDPATARHHRDLGEVLYELKSYERAEATLTKAVEMDPKDDTAWTGLARARTRLRRYPGGAEAYERACELRPKDKDIHLLLGAYYHEFLKDYEKAIQHYNKYVQLGGDAADVDDWLAEAQAELDRKKK